jgi:TPR repeat protein
VVAAWTVGVLILLALWFFWEDQANRYFNAKDYGKAREWYQKGADAGNALAMFNLGWLHQNGRGVAQDYGKACEWYQKAADAGNAPAMLNLGWLYQNGLAVG